MVLDTGGLSLCSWYSRWLWGAARNNQALARLRPTGSHKRGFVMARSASRSRLQSRIPRRSSTIYKLSAKKPGITLSATTPFPWPEPHLSITRILVQH